ncbi:MAG: hypothetical protein C4582_07275 [Desulfobacteraceae bacterium]|jgi:hypothetical protein|nr:MAG: hypothetical protein C4582_07275 [Desulfobacteraceae bacterium]
MVLEAYNNEEYILDAENTTGVEFTTREKEMDARIKTKSTAGRER